MAQTRTNSAKFAMVIGVFLLIEGIWGMFRPVVFGVLTTNTTHAVIHIVLGILGIYLGSQNHASGYCKFIGVLLLLVGVLRFIPGVGDIIVQILNVNYAVAILNISVGIISLAISAKDRAAKNA